MLRIFVSAWKICHKTAAAAAAAATERKKERKHTTAAAQAEAKAEAQAQLWKRPKAGEKTRTDAGKSKTQLFKTGADFWWSCSIWTSPSFLVCAAFTVAAFAPDTPHHHQREAASARDRRPHNGDLCAAPLLLVCPLWHCFLCAALFRFPFSPLIFYFLLVGAAN